MVSNQTPPPDETSSRLDRLRQSARNAGDEVLSRLSLHPVRNAFVLAALSTLVVALGVAMRLVVPEEPKEKLESPLVAALTALDEEDLDRARNIAADLRLVDSLPEEDRGGPAFVLGIVMAREAAEQVDGRERKIRFLLASRYLQECRTDGFPKGQLAEGLFTLGKSYHEAGEYAQSLEPLQAAFDARYKDPTEIHRLLMLSYLKDAVPRHDKALDHCRSYLADDALGFHERYSGLLTQSEILFALGQDAACEATLAAIPESTPEYPRTLLLRARALLRDGDALAANAAEPDTPLAEPAISRYEAARELLALARQNSRDPEVVRQAAYLTGLTYRRTATLRADAQDAAADLRTALEHLSKTRRASLDTPEGISAALEEAEIQQLFGDLDTVTDSFRTVIRAAADLVPYNNPWVSKEEFQTRLEAAYAAFRDARQWEPAIRLAEAMPPMMPLARAIELQAEAQEALALQKMEQAAERSPSEAIVLTSEARMDHRLAGLLYSQLSQLRLASRDYPRDLWKSASNYLAGRDYERAVDLLRNYLQVQNREARPPALTALGEALLALNRPEEALPWLIECIDFHSTDPHSYRARVVAAQAQRELGNREQAKVLLEGNLRHESLTPRSIEWRQSLFDIGQLYYLEGIEHETQSRLKGVNSEDLTTRRGGLQELQLAAAAFREASGRLSEAVQRDPQAPQAVEARYMIAESFRQAAKLPRKELPTVSIETTVRQLNEQMNDLLGKAESQYAELLRILNGSQEQTELSEVEQRILRNCYFARAEALYDMQRYEEALQAYSDATNRYQHEPESLEAYVQIANCHRRLNRPVEARGTLEQAKVILNRIRPEADFAATTRYNREEWGQLLDWLGTL